MKRILPVLIGVAFIAASCTKEPPVVAVPEVPVTKKIAFEVFTQKNYNDAFYDNALAEVHLSIAKTGYKDNTTTIVWDTTYSFRQFRHYPEIAQKIAIEKIVPHYESSELLHVSKVVRYSFNGYMSMEAAGEDVLRNQTYKLVTVSF